MNSVHTNPLSVMMIYEHERRARGALRVAPAPENY
jgi:hypothetical protein